MMPIEGDTRLSYSSANLLKNCSQKYYYYKVLGIAKDVDYDDNQDALNIGKAFHWILEQTAHEDVNIVYNLDIACEEFDVEHKKPMIHAMLLKYLKLHKEVGLQCIQTEFQVSDNRFVGFIDAILADDKGNWWIADLKTAGRLSDTTIKRLHNDYQLNLYAFHIKSIADTLDLDESQFQGIRYRATTKSPLKKRKDETYKQFVIRLYQGITSHDVAIRKEHLDPDSAMHGHMLLHDYSMMLRKGEIKPAKNFGYCDAYFRPCEYWSQCHGKNFTEENDKLEIYKK